MKLRTEKITFIFRQLCILSENQSNLFSGKKYYVLSITEFNAVFFYQDNLIILEFNLILNGVPQIQQNIYWTKSAQYCLEAGYSY